MYSGNSTTPVSSGVGASRCAGVPYRAVLVRGRPARSLFLDGREVRVPMRAGRPRTFKAWKHDLLDFPTHPQPASKDSKAIRRWDGKPFG